TLTDGSSGARNLFGFSTSISGDRILIGSPTFSVVGTGSAYIFELSAGVWGQTAELFPADGADGDDFGLAVSLSGNRALVGSLRNNDRAGSAYIFDFNGSNWSQTAKLSPTDGIARDSFGISVSLSNDRALIGAIQFYLNGHGTGAAYIFDFDGNIWSETAKLLASDGMGSDVGTGFGDGFGSSVSLLDDRALISSPYHDSGGMNHSGAAYIFDLQGGVWRETAKLEAADGAVGDEFGGEISLGIDQALVGAEYHTNLAAGTNGSAYIFSLSPDGVWNQEEFSAPGSITFGRRVSISADRALIGDPGRNRATWFNLNKGNLTLLDPACTASSCDGQFLRKNNDDMVFPVNDAEILATELSVVRLGIITDGVSQILLRKEGDEAVTFQIFQPDGTLASGVPPCQWGTLSSFGSSPSCSTITISPEATSLGSFAFASYQAPADFPGTTVSESISINIKAVVSSGGTVTKELELRTPPVVLVHGVWSNSDAWRGKLRTASTSSIFSFEEALEELGFDVFLVDHSDIDDSTGSFDPSFRSPVIERFITQGIEQTRYTLRQKGFAISQVDVIGHSMGGLVARSRVKYSLDPYFSMGNYFKGDYHKLISIGSPHQGTEIADALIQNKCVQRNLCVPTLPHGTLACSGISLEDVFNLAGKPLGAAIYGFQTGSDALNKIGQTDVVGHAIVGVAPSAPDSDTEDNLNLLLALFNLNLTIDGLMGGNGGHDTIVPLLSQRGGVASNAFTASQGVVHAGVELDLINPDDIQETASQDIFSIALSLLANQPVASDSFSSFGLLPAGGQYIAPADCPNPRAANNRGSLAEISFMPAQGTLVSQGQAIQIQFNIIGGEPIDGVIFAINGGLHSITGAPPYSFEYTTPGDKAGRIDIHAQTVGSGSEHYAFDTHIIVQPDQDPVSLTALPTNISFSQPGRNMPLYVVGTFPNDIEIDISSSVTGTNYTVLSGTQEVISVSPDGVINAIGVGQDTILVSNAGLTTNIIVKVSPELPIFINGFE
ncbi:MAG: hypothetical protein L3J52_05370, partial [Proteobacteria bacterium]|nr:hypothetical protein [Pseudomonadota bacterium]